MFLKGDIEVGDIIYIIIWVDDILSFYHGKKGLANHKEYMEVLKKRFTVKDMGEVKRYIGMQISRNQERGELIVSQRPAITEFLMAFGYQESRTRNTPVTGGIMLAKAKEEDMRTQDPYRSLIGSINYVVQYSRPDLAFSIGLFSRFMSDPTEEHWKYLQNVVKYIAGTVDLCLVYRKWIGDFMPHIGYSDANFVSELESAKSTYGYCTFLGNDLISWKSKLSTTVATSTTISELDGAYNCLTQMLWEDGMLKSFRITSGPFILYVDNKAVVELVNGDKQIDRTKHEAVRIEFIREKVKKGIVEFRLVSSGSNISDIFTKALGATLFGRHVSSMGMEERFVN